MTYKPLRPNGDPIETWPEQKRRHMNERIELIKALKMQGLSLTETATRLDLSAAHLSTVLRRAGLKWATMK